MSFIHETKRKVQNQSQKARSGEYKFLISSSPARQITHMNFMQIAVITVEPTFQRCSFQSARKRDFRVNVRSDVDNSKRFTFFSEEEKLQSLN